MAGTGRSDGFLFGVKEPEAGAGRAQPIAGSGGGSEQFLYISAPHFVIPPTWVYIVMAFPITSGTTIPSTPADPIAVIGDVIKIQPHWVCSFDRSVADISIPISQVAGIAPDANGVTRREPPSSRI